MNKFRNARFHLTLLFCLGLLLFGAGLHLRWLGFIDNWRGLTPTEHRTRVYGWGLLWADRLLSLFGSLVDLDIDYRLPPPGLRPPAIVIANHRSSLDPLLILAALKRMGYGKVRSIAKEEAACLPVVGRGAREMGSAFVTRRRDPDDIERVRQCALGASRDAACVLIFPEGTTYGDEAFRTRSDVAYQHVLPPRFGGVRTLLEVLPDYRVLSLTIDWQGIDGAHDIGHLRPLAGKRLVVEAVYLDHAPTKPVEEWLTEEWLRKDRRLADSLADV